MRLIDADEFIKGLEDLYQQAGWDRRDVHFSLADTICNLDMMPTVDAIPVAWIEQYGKANWYDFGTQYNAITKMLEEWERKEE